MDPDVKDRFLSHPNAKKLSKKYERDKEKEAEEGSVETLRAEYGMKDATDEELMLYHIMKGDAEIKQIKPPKTYYSGKEPLAVLLNELNKDYIIDRLTLQKENRIFEYKRL